MDHFNNEPLTPSPWLCYHIDMGELGEVVCILGKSKNLSTDGLMT